jgi:hypothetical protein
VVITGGWMVLQSSLPGQGFISSRRRHLRSYGPRPVPGSGDTSPEGGNLAEAPSAGRFPPPYAGPAVWIRTIDSRGTILILFEFVEPGGYIERLEHARIEPYSGACDEYSVFPPAFRSYWPRGIR